MRARLLNVLLLAALAVAFSRLWLFLGEPPPSLPPVPAGVAAPEETTAASEQIAAAGETGPAAYDVIVARDLFSPARGVVPPAPIGTPKPAARAQPPPKLTLYGVVIVEGEKAAFIQEGAQEARPRKVRENESFAGGVVKAIRPDGVTFLFAGSEIIVPLRAPKERVGAPSPRDQDAGGSTPRPGAPAASPRRQMPTATPQMPVPGRSRQMPPAPGMPADDSPFENEIEVFGNEEFPEGGMPGDDMPGADGEGVED